MEPACWQAKPPDRRMAEHGGGHAGLLDHAVLVDQGRYPPQIHRVGLDRPAAQHEAGIGGIVGNSVGNFPRPARGGIDSPDACIDDLDCGQDIVGSAQNVADRHAGSPQFPLEDEGQFHLDPRLDEARDRDIGIIGEQHFVQQHTVVGFIDIGRTLHGTAG